MAILVTGGAGYIGSHTCLSLIKEEYDVVVLDNLSTSKIDSIRKIENYCGVNIPFYKGDISESGLIDKIFAENKIDACIHFAALKSVGESFIEPDKYYKNNVDGTSALLKSLIKNKCKRFIFSSTAAIYGNPETFPITEEFSVGKGISPYAETKYKVECILESLANAESEWGIVILRYFNPLGAHPDGFIGENLSGTSDNLMPYITKTAFGEKEWVNVFGNDYDTYDGTGVRDYIHVMDLAEGHIAALKYLEKNSGVHLYNLGTGRGYSVFEVINTFEEINEVMVPYKICDRRIGDIAVSYCSPDKAYNELGWKAKRSLKDMCKDAWNWQQKYPK